ncbi:MAG: flagellar M-ring protein FliF, partial [Frankiales bacterium]|nr:flagellar M-ring protein FliF [Frankiales bacterium]
VIIGLLAVVAVVGGMRFMKWVTAPSYGVRLAGMAAKDAAAVTAKLDTDGVTYKLEGGGSTVLVPNEVLDTQRLAVAAAGLPAGKTDAGWAAFDKGGLTSSSFQQHVAYQRAMEATLASSVEGIDGVRSAEVHLALPEKKLFTEQKEAARASVLVESTGALDDEAVDAMTHLVASAVPGLAPADVSITDSSGRLITGNGATTGATRAAKERQAYEDTLSTRVTTMFDTLLGPGRAVVRVNAEMDTANRTIDRETFDKDRAVVGSSAESKETYATAPVPDPAGTLTQAPDNAATAANDYNKTQTTVTNLVSREVEHEEVAAGGVKRLTVAVAVEPNGTPAAPPAAEMQRLVAAAVGLDPARGDSIAVTTPAFVQGEDQAEAAQQAPSGGPAATASQYGPKALGGVLLLLVGLGFLRTVKKGLSTEVTADQLNAALEGAGGKRGKDELGAGAQAALPSGSVPAPRTDDGQMLELLDDNPDELAGLLRGWLANTGAER